MSSERLNKALWTDINKLKQLNAETDPKFILDQSPFSEQEETGGASAITSKELIITGRILPDSEIYKDGAYQIELKLPTTYPHDPPAVRFITKIYHPNVDKDGKKKKGNLNNLFFFLIFLIRSILS